MPTPTPTPTPVPTPFGVVWIPDTQKLTATYDEEILAQLDTLGEDIATRIDSEQLVAVLHTGDIVDFPNRTWQWEHFDRCLNAFIDRIPFYPVSGNHDIGKYDSLTGGGYGGYLKQPFLQRLPEGQTFEGGKMFYAVLNDGDAPILLLGLGYDMGRERKELAWIDEVLTAHADMPCVIITHAFQVRPGTILSYCNYIEQKIVRKYPNIRMILCGHARGFFRNVMTYDDDGDGAIDRSVQVLMLNDQDGEFLYRILRFDPVERTVEVRTYKIGSDERIPDSARFKQPADFTIEDAF